MANNLGGNRLTARKRDRKFLPSKSAVHKGVNITRNPATGKWGIFGVPIPFRTLKAAKSFVNRNRTSPPALDAARTSSELLGVAVALPIGATTITLAGKL